jgi:homogentisate 1,2-dioxygenase
MNFSWLYRIRPSVCHEPFQPMASPSKLVSSFGTKGPNAECESNPNQLRWSPFEYPSSPTDFVDGLETVCGQGDPSSRSGILEC